MAKPSLWGKVITSLFITIFMVGTLWAEESIKLKSSLPEKTRERPRYSTIGIGEEKEALEEESVEKRGSRSSSSEEESSYPDLPLLKPLPLSGIKANKKIISQLLKDLESKNPALRCWAAMNLRELDIQKKEREKVIKALRKAFKKEKHLQVKRAIKDVLLELEGEDKIFKPRLFKRKIWRY